MEVLVKLLFWWMIVNDDVCVDETRGEAAVDGIGNWIPRAEMNLREVRYVVKTDENS